MWQSVAERVFARFQSAHPKFEFKFFFISRMGIDEGILRTRHFSSTIFPL